MSNCNLRRHRCFEFYIQGSQNVLIETCSRGPKFNRKIPIHSEDINKKQTFYQWNAQPSEIKDSHVMVENRMEALDNTFLILFYDNLDAPKLHNIINLLMIL